MHVIAAHVGTGTAEIAAATGGERRADQREQDGLYEGPDLADCFRHCESRRLTATTTAPRRCARFRPVIAAGFGLALDADHGKDQNRSHLRARCDVPRRAHPATGRKFDDGPHVSSLNCRATGRAAATWEPLRSAHG